MVPMVPIFLCGGDAVRDGKPQDVSKLLRLRRAIAQIAFTAVWEDKMRHFSVKIFRIH